MERHLVRDLLVLHDIRLDEGLSYRALAEQIGVPETVLYRAIHRITAPSARSAHRMRQFIDGRKRPVRRRAS